MAVLALFAGSITQTQYDTLRKEIDWETNQPPGGILHIAAFDDAGYLQAADIWESPEDLNTFVEHRLMPAMQRHHIEPPTVSVFPTSVVQAFKAIEKFRI